MCEFAVSVLPHTRGRGYGKRLFAHAVRHCQNRRVDQLFIHALSENTVMLRIARGAGARLQHEGGESEAWLHLPPDSVGSHMTELVDTRAAALNHLIKRQQELLRWGLGLVVDLKARLAHLRGIASQ
jgi:RimJ/RimL family protein N-acetyltransferase